MQKTHNYLIKLYYLTYFCQLLATVFQLLFPLPRDIYRYGPNDAELNTINSYYYWLSLIYLIVTIILGIYLLIKLQPKTPLTKFTSQVLAFTPFFRLIWTMVIFLIFSIFSSILYSIEINLYIPFVNLIIFAHLSFNTLQLFLVIMIHRKPKFLNTLKLLYFRPKK